VQKAIGYIRVSTQSQADEGVSLAAQRAKIEAWCSLNDHELVAVFEDAGISGASMSGREGLHAAMKATQRGMALVSYSISRMARSTRDMLEIAERLDAKGADLVSVTEKIDTTTAAGRMVFKMLAVLADFERDQIGERTKMALAHKKAKGEVYAAVPFGFDALEGRLVEVKRESKIVAEILRKREAGSSLAEIADSLNAQGIEGKRGGRWYPSTVRYLINRQVAA
jgi:site-specific DNA recombinase